MDTVINTPYNDFSQSVLDCKLCHLSHLGKKTTKSPKTSSNKYNSPTTHLRATYPIVRAPFSASLFKFNEYYRAM